MIQVAAAVWNQIAKTQGLGTEAGRIAFRLNPEQLIKLDEMWVRLLKGQKVPEKLARCLPTCLPLLIESQAIQAYVSQNPGLANALPEVNDANEAALLMQSEYRLSPEETSQLQSLLESPASLKIWETAAKAVTNKVHGRDKSNSRA